MAKRKTEGASTAEKIVEAATELSDACLDTIRSSEYRKALPKRGEEPSNGVRLVNAANERATFALQSANYAHETEALEGVRKDLDRGWTELEDGRTILAGGEPSKPIKFPLTLPHGWYVITIPAKSLTKGEDDAVRAARPLRDRVVKENHVDEKGELTEIVVYIQFGTPRIDQFDDDDPEPKPEPKPELKPEPKPKDDDKPRRNEKGEFQTDDWLP
jgi:hypothetical protein